MADWIRVKVWKVDVEKHEELLGLEPAGEAKAVPMWVNMSRAVTMYPNTDSNEEYNIDFGDDLIISVIATEHQLLNAISQPDKHWRIH